MKGHESVVKQLLDREDDNPNQPDNEGRIPLLCAALGGHESIVKQLLNWQDVNPDEPDNEGRTPLSWAAIQGHESVVKQLLDRADVGWSAIAAQWDLSIDTVKDTAVKLASSEEIRDFG